MPNARDPFEETERKKKAKHLSGNWQRGRFQVECIIHLSFCAGSLLSLMRRLLQALERCRFWSGSGVPLVRVHSHFHFRLSKTLDKAPRHLLWQAEPRQVPRPLPLSTPQRANPTPFSRSVCFGHFGHYVAPTPKPMNLVSPHPLAIQIEEVNPRSVLDMLLFAWNWLITHKITNIYLYVIWDINKSSFSVCSCLWVRWCGVNLPDVTPFHAGIWQLASNISKFVTFVTLKWHQLISPRQLRICWC